ncbi:family 20 glycosylhydrolase, partial [Aeromonas salmonicida]|uniref:family 20 glycosylhydrolase n=1 Tax=Aeromonas salmonicida TaxID=645 RepID=UPI003D319D1C
RFPHCLVVVGGVRCVKEQGLYKFNRFHWHLTDDEGWRLEIKAFPPLTEIAAWRGHDLPVGPQLSGCLLYTS